MDNATPYQVIARKYRPQTFSSVVGQEAIVTTLKNGLRFKRLAHAYLFCGCRGTGKTTLARVFAKALNCLQPTADFEPCNNCPSCLDITSGRSLDVLEIDGASNRGIDDIRQINETVGYAPALGQYKIYIIDEVHMLTKEAFNALLKTLEEPPSHVKFFFATTEPHKILPTILSRCQRFDLNRIAFDTLKQKLLWITQDLKVPCEEEVLSLVATLAEGSLRDAESLLDQIICYADHPITLAKVSSTLGIMPRVVFFALDKAFSEQNLSYAFELASDIFSSGKDLSYFLDHLTEHYRALLKLKLDPSFKFPTAKLKEQYVSSLPFYTEEQCVYILDYLIQSQQQLNKSPFKRVHLEMLLLHVIRSKNRLTLPSLVRRLQELEKQLKEPHQVANTPAVTVVPVPVAVIEEAKPQQLPAEEPPEVAVAPIPVAVIEEIKPQRLPVEEPPEVAVAPIPVAVVEEVKPQPPAEVAEETKPQQLLAEEVAVEEEQIEESLTAAEEFSDKAIEEPAQDLSLDELLINKIQKKLDSLPQEPAPRPASLLLSKVEWETKAIQTETPAQEITVTEEIPIKAIQNPQQSKEPSPQGCHYDTLIRFAAVELEGIIKTSTK